MVKVTIKGHRRDGGAGVDTGEGRAPGGAAPEGYDKYAFEPFAVTVDLAVLTVRAGALQVLLVERGTQPYAGRWALPGGFVLPRESAEEAARRELAEETGLSDLTGLHLEQLRTYSDPDRDPRMRVVSVAFAALLPDPPEPHGGGDAARAMWLPFDGLAPLAFDHDRILADAHDRVGAKLEYSCLATSFCPPEFTLGELQHVYETVWGTALDRPNFRRKVLATPGFVEQVPGAARLTGGRGKPAALYRAGDAKALHPPLLRPTS
ncbi:NUDIX domain-containing protein [Streptomyces sp. NPDC127038]|uniref:NUDIX hydrolase n=1 Tax=Streptomyces sp. NPDC127038 TaxID=3347114 RepID=UPI003665885E